MFVNCRPIHVAEVGIKNALFPDTNARSKAMNFNSYVAAARADADNRVSFRGLSLVKPRKKAGDKEVWIADPAPSATAMRHNFAIWALEKPEATRRPMHLYYCIRCKWAFQVDDRSGSVTPLDQNGTPTNASAAGERLVTFGLGPCPAFSVTGSARLTKILTCQESLIRRLAALAYTMKRKLWKRPGRLSDHLARSAKA